MKARFRLPRQVVAREQAAAAAYRRPAWLRGDVDGIVADLLAFVRPKLRRVALQPREAHWHEAAAELAAYRMTVQEIGIIRRSARKLPEQARLIDALLAGAGVAVEQIRQQAQADYEAACAAELAAAAEPVEADAATVPDSTPVGPEPTVAADQAAPSSELAVDVAAAGSELVAS